MGKVFEPKDIRNVALAGASGTGKTTLAESLLFTAGRIKEMGSVDRGTTYLDFDEEEIQRKMSIRSSMAYLEWDNVKINVVDTPGNPDLVGDVRSSFRVTEGIIFVLDADEGLTMETEKDWHVADDYQISRLVFINKMDEEHADFYKVADSLSSKFETRVVPIQLPIGKGADFKGTVDLVHKKAFLSSENGVHEAEIPEEMMDKVHEYSEILFDAVAEIDDGLIEKVLEGLELTPHEVEDALKKCIMLGKVIPVMCGSAAKAIGSHILLDTIVHSLPSPLFVGESVGHVPGKPEVAEARHPSLNEPFSAYVFKTRIDPFAGRISYCRIRSGSISHGEEFLIAGSGDKEKASHLYEVSGKKPVEIDKACAGDILILAKVENLFTGDTICSASAPIEYERAKMPSPAYFVAIHSEDRKTQDKITDAFHIISMESETFNYYHDPITKEMVVACMGEMQARIAFDFVKHKYKLNFETAAPRVAYKETILSKADGIQYKHKKQSGGHGQYGEVYIRMEPLARDEGFIFEEKIVGGKIPKNYFPAIEKGCEEALEHGVVAGYPVVDVKVTLFEGSYHDVDSSDMAFKIAARQAVKLALEEAKSVILEPVAEVKVYVNEEFIGPVLSDLSNRRGKVEGQETKPGGITIIQAHVPYSEMLVYLPALNSITSGQGSYEMHISHYDVLPDYEKEKALKQAEEMKEDE